MKSIHVRYVLTMISLFGLVIFDYITNDAFIICLGLNVIALAIEENNLIMENK